MTTSNPTQEDGSKLSVVGIKSGPTMPTIEFDRGKFKRMQVGYNQAVADGEEVFTFDGYEFVTNYAKYMLEYIDGRLE